MERVEAVAGTAKANWQRTRAEQHFDLLIEERRLKGRQTYGKGLDHNDDYDWNQMALEEALDMVQYLAAENLRLRERLLERDPAGELHQQLMTGPVALRDFWAGSRKVKGC